MQVSRWTVLGCGLLVIGCASGMSKTNVLTPLGAHLSVGAKTGAPIPLRIDPNAKVVIARVGNLPAAPFTNAQADRGEKVFNTTCASCHQDERFIGKQFVDDWGDRRVGDFYQLVRNTMPVDNPGGLKDQDYLDVTAYLLKANHASPTPDSLSADTLVMRGRKIGVHP